MEDIASKAYLDSFPKNPKMDSQAQVKHSKVGVVTGV